MIYEMTFRMGNETLSLTQGGTSVKGTNGRDYRAYQHGAGRIQPQRLRCVQQRLWRRCSHVDGFAPLRWIGPGAEARWWADAETWGKAGGVVKEHISFEGIRCCEVIGTRAYAVLSATLTITLKAREPIVRPGILVYSFARQGDVWKAEGHTWGRLS